MSEECLFCKIAVGDIPCEEVYSDQDLIAFRDIAPAAPTHILVIPKKHIPGIADATQEDEALMGRLVMKANEIAQSEGLHASGFRYVINTGADGGQTVSHLHLHILGGRAMTWPPG